MTSPIKATNYFIGSGAIACALASHLVQSKAAVKFVVRQSRLTHHSKPEQLVVEFTNGSITQQSPRPGVTAEPDYSEAQRVFIACKHQHLSDVIEQLKALPTSVVIVPCLNGVAHLPTLKTAFPDNPICPLTVMFNAQLPEPMHAVITTSPLVYVDGDDPALVQLLKAGGLLVKQGSEATAWGKLILNLNNAIGALTDSTFKDLLLNPTHRQIGLATFSEATDVLNAANIKFAVPIPVSWQLQMWTLKYVPKLAWQVAKKRNQLSDQSYPSMHADLVAGSATEVAELNGEIVRQAELHGLSAPINRQLMQLVQARHGEAYQPMSISELHEKLKLAS